MSANGRCGDCGAKVIVAAGTFGPVVVDATPRKGATVELADGFAVVHHEGQVELFGDLPQSPRYRVHACKKKRVSS